jgi:uncharacterized membrane protein YbaN (DUF454 family)
MEHEQADLRPEVEIDETAKTIRVRDVRVFHAGRRAFCRRLIVAVTRRPVVCKAVIDLGLASCRIEFEPGTATPQEMAEIVADSVREASGSAPAEESSSRWRRAVPWVVLSAYRSPTGVSVWETLGLGPGRLRLRNQRLAGDHTRLSRLADAFSDLKDVAACHLYPWARQMTVDVSPSPVAYRFLDEIERIRDDVTTRETQAAGTSEPAPSQAKSPSVATGLKRPMYLALAGGSFVMSVVGVIVPGIPTVPFLLATSYFLARSSPWLDSRLRRTVFFGPILQEWEQFGGLSRASKGKLIALTGAIIAVTVIFAPLSPVALAVILLASSISIYGIVRTPGLPEEPLKLPGPGRATQLALTAF